jgi:vitamin B12 transporter
LFPSARIPANEAVRRTSGCIKSDGQRGSWRARFVLESSFMLPSFGGRKPSAFPLLGALCCLAITSLVPVQAQTQLSPVVVTAHRAPSRADQTLAEVTLIERAALDRAAGRTLTELLAQQPGVQLSANGGLGKTSSVFLRGTESRHTLLLIDGVRYGAATVGTPSWDNLPLENIERIEIVRGPLSSLYGSDAVGGVVQIFTRKGQEGLHPSASLTAGSNRYAQGAAGVRFGQSHWDGSLSLQHTRTHGFSATNSGVSFGFNPDDDAFKQSAAALQLGLKLPGQWRTDVRASYADGRSHFDDGLGADTQAQLLTKLLSWSASGPVTPQWRSTLRVAQSSDESDTWVSAGGAFNLGPYATEQQQFSLENTLTTPIGQVLLLAERLQQKVSKPGAAYPVNERSINALAAGLSSQHAAHTWQANVRRDENSQFGSETTGTVGYGYDLTSAWRVAGSAGTSFVAPSFNQLYFPSFGNPDLQPERGTSGELSLRWTAPGQQLRLAYFENKLRGFMATTGTSTSSSTPINIPRAEIKGWALSHEAQWSAVTIHTSYDYVDPRNKDVRSSGALGSNFDKRLPRRAKNNLKLAADWASGVWSVGTTLVASSERFDNAANTSRLAGFATLDVRADWRFAPQWSLGLRLNNVADKTYETARGYNQARREGFVTLRYTGL